MKLILLSIIVFLFNLSFGQTNQTIKFHCCQPTSIIAVHPLFIIDDIVVDDCELKSLKVEDVKSITVLKGSVASALYGSRGVNGVIIIEKVTSKITEIVVRDSLLQQPIPSATITMVSNFGTDSITLISNDSGYVSTKKLKLNTEYEIKVSAIGYKGYITNIKAGEKAELFLERNFVSLPQVTVSSIQCRRRIRCGFMIKIIKSNCSREETIATDLLKLFPNPTQSQSVIHIQLKQSESGYYYLQLFNASGQSVFNKEVYLDVESKLLSIDLPTLETGNYFVKLTNKSTGKFFTSKLMIK